MNQKLNLTIQSTRCKLDGLSCFETISEHKLKLLITSTVLLKEPFHQFENEKQQLIKYLKLLKDGQASVNYHKSGSKFGRVYAKHALGLQSLRKEIRHTLTHGIYVDIDIENCHPVLLMLIIESNGIACKYLRRYVENREEALTQIMTIYDVTREASKQLFIRLLYGGSFDAWVWDNNLNDAVEAAFLKKFKKELVNINKIIVASNPELLELLDDKNNADASVCSYFLQEYENRILESVYKHAVVKNNCVLCFDGLMIPKADFKPELLDELHQRILLEFGMSLTFTTKNLDMGYSTEELEQNQVLSENTNYGQLKMDFDKLNFKILEPLMFATIKEDGHLVLRNRADFMHTYEDILFVDESNGKEKSFVSRWLKDVTKITYDKIDFLPMQTAPVNIYNTFRGYASEKMSLQKTDIKTSLIYHHIKNIVCNSNEDLFNYFMKWLANLVQHPFKKANTSFVLKGEQGTGKDTVFNWFGNRILGKDYYFNEDNVELLFGRFNSCIENKILIVLNEASGKDTFLLNEKIKNAITRDINTIEHKGLKPYDNYNNIGYVFLTNNDNPVKVTHGERRFFCSECNGSMANNNEYFNALYSEINSGDYDRAFFNYFSNLDLTSMDFNNRPTTSFYESMREMNTPIIAKFFEHLVDQNADSNNASHQASHLFCMFNDFVKANIFKAEYSSTKFGIDILKYKGVYKTKTKAYYLITLLIPQLRAHLISEYHLSFSNVEFIDAPIMEHAAPDIFPLDI